MATLSLVLTHYWYEETESGRKSIEYRAMSDHWKRLIWDRKETLHSVRFSRGYSKKILTRAITTIDVGPCPIEGWEGDYYRIHFENAEESSTDQQNSTTN